MISVAKSGNLAQLDVRCPTSRKKELKIAHSRQHVTDRHPPNDMDRGIGATKQILVENLPLLKSTLRRFESIDLTVLTTRPQGFSLK